MRRILFPAAMLFATLPAAAAPPPPLTLHAAATITNAEASLYPPVSFEATVTYYRSYAHELMVQDGNDAIYVAPTQVLKLSPGDRIRVTGTMHESFRPIVNSNDITLIGPGALPKPDHPSFEQMIWGKSDSKFATVRGLIRSVDFAPDDRTPKPVTYLYMLVQGGPVVAIVDDADENAIKDLLDAEVEITGVIGGIFDNKMQQTGILIHIPSIADVKILKHAGSDPWSLPVTPMNRIIEGYRTVDLSQRMRVRGTITYYQPGRALVLQDGRRSLWIKTDSWNSLRVGDVADAIGFPSVENGSLTLIHSEIRDSMVRAPVTPPLLAWRALLRGRNAGLSHIYELVSVEGQVVAQVQQATQDTYVLESEGHLFSAILPHPLPISPTPAPPPPMMKVPLGSRIRVTGVCIPVDASILNDQTAFDILMRDVDDIVVVARSPLLNVRSLTLIVGILLALVIALGMRGWYMERRTRHRIGTLAYIEQRRARILEDINHSKPLAGILERITELVSVRLNGAPCWCQVVDGATLGNRPDQLHSSSLRTVEHPIAARSGPPLGAIYAVFHARTKPTTTENEALAVAAELATLAIETSRLYSDLVHRSEFDLLTDTQNRFAMEKTLDAMIQTARETAGIFGLIYIDLNEFKQVNDVYGHQAGDLYLQELTQRMKRQLRPGDTLARLGGDEFAVLVSEVRQRADVEEITARLECCFHEPFIGENYAVQGSASFGMALYPDDASSADGLLRVADAAMYVAKSARLEKKRSPGDQADAELAHKDHA
ncbi:MAG: diguanylate cyclase [Terracidiphilus sp.]|jgi:diguanylate cyclase (GGDEF)-like protein